MLIDKDDTATLALIQSWIQDLANTGMSHTRIAARLNLSSSTIRKIAAEGRTPQLKTLKNLSAYYLKIFENPQSYNTSIMNYASKHAERIAETLQKTRKMMDWISISN